MSKARWVVVMENSNPQHKKELTKEQEAKLLEKMEEEWPAKDAIEVRKEALNEGWNPDQELENFVIDANVYAKQPMLEEMGFTDEEMDNIHVVVDLD